LSFTGSVGAGRARSPARAGQRLVSCMLELGGKSPNIVFSDANLDQAEGRRPCGDFLRRRGQTCVAGLRAPYIQESIYDQFVERIVAARPKTIALGDPMRADTQMGPVATKMQLEKRRIDGGGERSARARRSCAAASVRSWRRFPEGYFYQPTIVHQASKDKLPDAQRSVRPGAGRGTPFADEAEVLALANDTEFRPGRPASGRARSTAPTKWRASSRPARCG